jgi:hypothetical protein
MAIELDIEMITKIKQAYQIIITEQLPDDANGVQERINLVRFLEGSIRPKTEFKNTADFRMKMSHFLMKKEVILTDTLKTLQRSVVAL